MRLIDADALRIDMANHTIVTDDLYGMGIMAGVDSAIKTIAKQPTIDAVPVVRCGECGWREDELCGHPKNDVVERVPEIGKYYRIAVHQKVYKNHFCSYGERREDDAAPVVHGRWEGTADGYWNGELVYDIWNCSECGYDADGADEKPNWKYCPNCGAKMDLEVDE